jgi:hypothetical protein
MQYTITTNLENGVENLSYSEHFDFVKIISFVGIEKVLSNYKKLLSDSIAGINIEILDYKL